jgi:hypothetical protein
MRGRELLRGMRVSPPILLAAMLALVLIPAARAGAASSEVIFLGQHPEDEASHIALASARLDIGFRTISPNKNDGYLLGLQGRNRRVYFTVASTDFVTNGSPLYVPKDDGLQVIARTAVRGLYAHELVARLASANGWDWAKAVNQVDWQLMDAWVTRAGSLAKRFIWSEPAEGWQYIYANARARFYLAKWRSALVPMFATNFQSASSGYHMPAARAGAKQVADAYTRGVMGESVQSWYFYEQGIAPTVQGVIDLFNYGRGQPYRTSYFQIEGTPADTDWGSGFMNGVKAYAQGITAGTY